MSSSIRPKIVFSPIFKSGLGKFLVSSPSLVAYPAAITTFFISTPSLFYVTNYLQSLIIIRRELWHYSVRIMALFESESGSLIEDIDATLILILKTL